MRIRLFQLIISLFTFANGISAQEDGLQVHKVSHFSFEEPIHSICAGRDSSYVILGTLTGKLIFWYPYRGDTVVCHVSDSPINRIRLSYIEDTTFYFVTSEGCMFRGNIRNHNVSPHCVLRNEKYPELYVIEPSVKDKSKVWLGGRSGVVYIYDFEERKINKVYSNKTNGVFYHITNLRHAKNGNALLISDGKQITEIDAEGKVIRFHPDKDAGYYIGAKHEDCIIIKNNIRNNISFVCDDSSIEVIPLEEKLLQLTEIYVLHDEYVLFGGHGSGLRALNVKDYSIASVKTEPNLLSVVHGLGLSLDGRFVTTLEEKKVTLWKFVREHIPEDTLIVKYIYFKLRSDEFENPSLVEKEMDSLIGLLSRYNTNYLIHIKAHTDMDLPPEYPDYELVKNLHIDLSKKRGNKIQKILISKGIAQNNIQVWPIGGQEPIVKDQKNSVLNRRVEFYIVKKSPPPPDRGE